MNLGAVGLDGEGRRLSKGAFAAVRELIVEVTNLHRLERRCRARRLKWIAEICGIENPAKPAKTAFSTTPRSPHNGAGG